ncbi:MAG: tetratricopeptide repeat protein [Promethearchaeota archaeon]
MQPFSYSEKNSINSLLEDLGFRMKLKPQNNLRYTIIKDRYIALTSKYPIGIGLRLNIPFEVISFYNSFLIVPRMINSANLEMINFLATNLKYISENLKLEHIFPIEEKKGELLNLLNKFMPEYFEGDNDRQWLTRIRISYLNKNELFKDISNEFYDELSKALKSIGLEPSWDLPISLSNGIPKLKKDLVLFYKNPTENEYLIIEPGFITFLRDFEQNHIILRTFFETYTPLLLHKVFGDVEGFSTFDIILNWIKFSRMCLNPHINVLNSEYIIPNELYRINLKLLFNSVKDISEIAFPIPILAREKLDKEELYIPKKGIIYNPPSTFNELKALELYQNADELAEKGEYSRASAVFADVLKIFNRYRQRVGTVKVLQKLASIASSIRKYNESINYLNQAIEISKTGKVPIEVIMSIHEQLGNVYILDKQLTKALNQFKIIGSFLKAHDPNKFHRSIQIVRLKMAKILIELGEFKDANLIFKNVAKEIEKYPDILAVFYLEKGRYFIKRENISTAIQTLKKGAVIENAKKNTLAQIFFELGKLYIYERKIGSKAQEYLLAAEKLLSDTKVSDLLFKIKIYEVLADAFNKTKDYEESRYYVERAQKIRKLLQLKGIY